MKVRHVLSAAAAALALAALTACSSTQTPPPTPPAATAPASPGAATPAQSADMVAASQGAHALEDLAELGKEKGSTDQVRTLAGEIYEQAEELGKQLDGIAEASGVTIPDAGGADQQAIIADLKARSGAQFDQAWIRAVLDLQQQVKAKAEAVLNSPNASEEAKAAARAVLAKLDAAVAKLQAAAGSAGATPPTAVDSGTGGQAAEVGLASLALALLGAGVLLLGGAIRLNRAARR